MYLWTQNKLLLFWDITQQLHFIFFPHSVITSLITRMRHGKERGHNAKEWEEIWHQFPQILYKVCLVIDFWEYYIPEKCIWFMFHCMFHVDTCETIEHFLELISFSWRWCVYHQHISLLLYHPDLPGVKKKKKVDRTHWARLLVHSYLYTLKPVLKCKMCLWICKLCYVCWTLKHLAVRVWQYDQKFFTKKKKRYSHCALFILK